MRRSLKGGALAGERKAGALGSVFRTLTSSFVGTFDLVASSQPRMPACPEIIWGVVFIPARFPSAA